MGCHHHRHPIQCIIPPHMLDSMKENGDEDVQKAIEEIELYSDELRSQRHDTTDDMAWGFVEGLFAVEGGVFAGPQIGLNRRVYNAEESTDLQKTLARSEGEDPHSDDAVNEAYDGAGATYNFFKESYNRDSLDNKGLPLVSSVHVRRKYNNAFWNGSQMAYGDGDGRIFTRFTQSLTVIGHELSHGVVQFSGGLTYRGQSGALNEHIADVFGVLTHQHKHNQQAKASDWLVGKEILAKGIKGDALRSMKSPGSAYNDPLLGKDPQPKHMEQYVNTSRDNGGVHINSGIPNHAFFLLCMELGGYAWQVPGTIWYNALQELNNSSATFDEWAERTVQTAGKLHGAGSTEEKAVRNAWKGVGLLTPEARTPTSVSTPTETSAPTEATAIAPTEAPKKKGFWAWLWGLFGFGDKS